MSAVAIAIGSAGVVGDARPLSPASGTVPAIDSGRIPMRRDQGRLLTIDAGVNGVGTLAVLDTGSTDILIDRRYLSRFGLHPVEPAYASTQGGKPAAPTTDILPDVTFSIGYTYRVIATAQAGDLSLPRMSSGADYGVLAGMSAFGSRTVDLNFSDMYVRVSGASGKPGPDYAAYPLERVKGIPVLTMPIDGRVMRVALDSGADADVQASTARFAIWKEPGDAETTIAGGGIRGLIVSRLITKRRLTIGAIPFASVQIEEAATSGTLGVDAILGLRVMQRMNVRLDMAKGVAYLAPSHVVPAPLAKSTAGLQLIYGSTARVMHVMRNGPADRAGWKPGDEICAIDGRRIPEVVASPALRGWGTGAPGTTVRLTMCSGEARALVLDSFY